jgi:hypothetical protein
LYRYAEDIASIAPCFVADVFLSNDGGTFSARRGCTAVAFS